MTNNVAEPVWIARPVIPVTHVPTGKVNDHQVKLNGSPSSAVLIVTDAAMHAHSSAKPNVGRP